MGGLTEAVVGYTTAVSETCTIGPNAVTGEPNAVTGERCGKPAVTTFEGRDGKVYAECAEHDVSAIVNRPALVVGASVTVTHGGIAKVGTVVKVGRTRCQVGVGIGNFLRGGSKVITRPISEVSAL